MGIASKLLAAAVLVAPSTWTVAEARGKAMCVEFENGNRANYMPGGHYEYTFADGQPPQAGRWTSIGSQYIINFDSGKSRVDRYSRDQNGMIIDINPGGDVFRGKPCRS